MALKHFINESDPEVYQPIFAESLANRKYKQHTLANFMKQVGKQKFNKGAEATQVTVADDVVVIRSERYLTKMEKYIIENSISGLEQVRQLRKEAMLGILQDQDIICNIECILEAKVRHIICDSFPESEYCIMILLCDRQIV